MKLSRSAFFYLLVIGLSSAVIYWIIGQGEVLESGRTLQTPNTTPSHALNDFLTHITHTITHPLAILLAQIISVILVARLFGWLCKRVGQPTVIGEILAGIVLGPSVVGYYFPEVTAVLFPPQSLGNLQFLSQIGLIMFMFVIGMELDLSVLKNRAHEAVVISHASIVIPFALGMGLSYFLYESFAPEHTQFLSFGLFMGIAMSITAFPVLARIVQERGMHKTRLGTMVITCAATDDVTAWCMLAAVIAIVKAGSVVSSLYVIAMSIAYVLFMLLAVRPFLRRIGDLHATAGTLGKNIVAVFFVTLLLSSYITEVIGIHALFGAFLAGAIMPENARFRSLFIEKIEDVALVLLLPLFFVFTGLRTQIGLLDDPHLWTVTGYIILVAVIGKFAGSAIAAKVVGQPWKDSLLIGALMNTRGLMELVVLNIGYDLGVLGPEIFAMMVLMALVTTVMTGPALDIIAWLFRDRTHTHHAGKKLFRILISFANPETGKSLLRLAHALQRPSTDHDALTVMHLSPATQLHYFNIEEYEKACFAPLNEEAGKLNLKINTLFKATDDIEGDIAATTNTGAYDLLLIGLGQSIFEGSLLGKVLGLTSRIINPDTIISTVTGKSRLFDNQPFDERTQKILTRSDKPVGILIDKKLTAVNRIQVPIASEEDASLLLYIQQLIAHGNVSIHLWDIGGVIQRSNPLQERIRQITGSSTTTVLHDASHISTSHLRESDLLLVSLTYWKASVQENAAWLRDIPSTLIINQK